MDSDRPLLAVLTQLLLLVTGVQSNWCGPLVVFNKPICQILRKSSDFELRVYTGIQYFITTYVENLTFSEALDIGNNRLDDYCNGNNNWKTPMSPAVPGFIMLSYPGYVVGRYLPNNLEMNAAVPGLRMDAPVPTDPLVKLGVTFGSFRLASAPFSGSLTLSNFAAHEAALKASCEASSLGYDPKSVSFNWYLTVIGSTTSYDVLEVQMLYVPI